MTSPDKLVSVELMAYHPVVLIPGFSSTSLNVSFGPDPNLIG